VADDPDPRWTPAQREVSRRDNAIDKVVMVGPVVVGAGRPISDGQPPIASAHRPDRPFDSRQFLRLVDACTWDGSGNVLLRYEVDRQTNQP
jgi:hypothetical protein